MDFESVDQVLDYAIKKEEEAFQFYTDFASKMNRPHMKKLFEEFAQEEKSHKAKLLAAKEGKLMIGSEQKILDLKLGDHLIDVELDSNLGYQDALIIAMKAEKAAYKLYNDLAEVTDDESLRNTLLSLAQEEAKHKLRFEVEYDDYVLEKD